MLEIVRHLLGNPDPVQIAIGFWVGGVVTSMVWVFREKTR